MLDLGYSDGLSVVSLFEQRGNLAAKLSGWQKITVAGHAIYAAEPDQRSLTWSSRGMVYTVMADAPAQTVIDVIGVLPHDSRPASGSGCPAASPGWRPGSTRSGDGDIARAERFKVDIRVRALTSATETERVRPVHRQAADPGGDRACHLRPERAAEDRLPGRRALRDLRRIAEGAKNDLREGLGPEFADFDIEDLNPKRFVQKHLFDDLNGDNGNSAGGTAQARPPRQRHAARPGERAPYDTDAT